MLLTLVFKKTQAAKNIAPRRKRSGRRRPRPPPNQGTALWS